MILRTAVNLYTILEGGKSFLLNELLENRSGALSLRLKNAMMQSSESKNLGMKEELTGKKRSDIIDDQSLKPTCSGIKQF